MIRCDLRLYEVRSLSEMGKIRDAWNHLALSAPTTTSFQTWEWNFGMAKHEGNSVRLRIVVAKDKFGEVVGIAPFWIRSNGIPGLSVLEFIGRGDYSDLFFSEPYKDIFVSSVMEWIECNTEWRIIHLHNVRQEIVDLISRYDGRLTTRPCGVCPYAQLPDTFEDYEQKVLQKRLRQKIRQKRKQLAGNGLLTFSVCETTSQLQADLPVFFDLHQRRQRTKGERGRFFEEKWRTSFEEISLALLRAGFLTLGLLRIDGQPAASLYNVRFQDQELSLLWRNVGSIGPVQSWKHARPFDDRDGNQRRGAGVRFLERGRALQVLVDQRQSAVVRDGAGPVQGG